jgi:hypothetical protein
MLHLFRESLNKHFFNNPLTNPKSIRLFLIKPKFNCQFFKKHQLSIKLILNFKKVIFSNSTLKSLTDVDFYKKTQ